MQDETVACVYLIGRTLWYECVKRWSLLYVGINRSSEPWEKISDKTITVLVLMSLDL